MGKDYIKNIPVYIRELRRLPLAEIIALLSDEIKKSIEKSKAKAEAFTASELVKLQDEILFFGRLHYEADYQFWAKADCWTADQAVALTFGRNPRFVHWGIIDEHLVDSPFVDEYEKRLKLVKKAIESETLTDPIVPIQILHWAEIKDIKYPDELVRLVRKHDTSTRMKNSKSVSDLGETEESIATNGAHNRHSVHAALSAPESSGEMQDGGSYMGQKYPPYERVISEAKDDGKGWITKARNTAQGIGEKQWASSIRQITARSICQAVATELGKDTTTYGARGARSSNTVRTEGLRGWKFKPPMEKTIVD